MRTLPEKCDCAGVPDEEKFVRWLCLAIREANFVMTAAKKKLPKDRMYHTFPRGFRRMKEQIRVLGPFAIEIRTKATAMRQIENPIVTINDLRGPLYRRRINVILTPGDNLWVTHTMSIGDPPGSSADARFR